MTDNGKNQNVSHLVGFSVGNQEFGVEILKVQEIIRMVAVTRLPNLPSFIEGVINLRGKVIPVIDFRKRFRLEEFAADSNAKRIVVVYLRGMVIGMVVDKVSQVLKVAADNIAPAPQTVKGPGSEYVSGVAMLEEKLVVLLDIDWILNEVERNSMAEAA